MALRETLRLKLADYTPKPGETRDTHVEVTVSRDTERKVVWLQISSIGVGDTFTMHRLSGPSKWIKLADSPTHAPKKFHSIADPVLTQFMERQGEHYETLRALLDLHGLSLAPTTAERLAGV